jgi:mRNA interferase RelE/StbE
MKVNLTKQFEKDFNKIEDKVTRSNIFRVIRNIQASKNIRDISKIKPLSGYPGYFRIKIGDYRIGFILVEKNHIQLKRVLHRQAMYKKFP